MKDYEYVSFLDLYVDVIYTLYERHIDGLFSDVTFEEFCRFCYKYSRIEK